MNRAFENEIVSVSTQEYAQNFWMGMRGYKAHYNELKGGKNSTFGSQMLPNNDNSRFDEEIVKHNVMRQICNVIYTSTYDRNVITADSKELAEWVYPGWQFNPENLDEFTRQTIYSHQLSVLTRIDMDFLADMQFDIRKHLTDSFARKFGTAEEAAFINGDGTKEPLGLLNDNGGAEIGHTVSETLTFDDIIRFYFSVKGEYRKNGVWLMNDETAMKLKMIKSDDGLPLWNHNSDTLLGKPVFLSEHMPGIGSGNKPVAFGDFRYYWILVTARVSVIPLMELFIRNNQTGYLGFEFLGGKLIRTEAIKTLSFD